MPFNLLKWPDLVAIAMDAMCCPYCLTGKMSRPLQKVFFQFNKLFFNRFSDFSEKSFQPIIQSLTLLIAAGADPMVADRLGKCCGHYLAEWRYTKERVDVSIIQLHLFEIYKMTDCYGSYSCIFVFIFDSDV